MIYELIKLFEKYSFRAGRNTRIGPEHTACLKFVADLKQSILEARMRVIYLHIANEYSGEEKRTFGGLLSALGRFAGAPDYIIMGQGRVICFEFKSNKGKLNPNQKIIQRWCAWAEVPYYEVKTSQEAYNKLILHGFTTPTKGHLQ